MKILNYLIVLLHVNAWVQFCPRGKLCEPQKDPGPGTVITSFSPVRQRRRLLQLSRPGLRDSNA